MVSAWNTDRGKSRSSSRNSTAVSAFTACWYARRYASYAEQLRSVVVHPVRPNASPYRALSKRVVMSARSRLRPTEKNRQPSSRLMVASTMPLHAAARSRTQPKNSCRAGPVPARARLPTSRYVVFSVSHSSDDSASRAPRAFSHAAPTEHVMEPEKVGSCASSAVTVAALGSAPMAASSAPIASSSARHTAASSARRSSSSRW